MIANDRQFHHARASLQRLQDALATEQLESCKDQDMAPELRDAAIASIQAQIDDLAAEITQFEDLKAGRLQTLALTSLLFLTRDWRLGRETPVKSVGYYWHFVDGVWVFIFSIVYLRTLF